MKTQKCLDHCPIGRLMKTDVPQLKLPDVPAVRLSFYGWQEGSGTCKSASIDGTETRAERPSWISGNAGVLAKTMRCPAKTNTVSHRQRHCHATGDEGGISLEFFCPWRRWYDLFQPFLWRFLPAFVRHQCHVASVKSSRRVHSHHCR